MKKIIVVLQIIMMCQLLGIEISMNGTSINISGNFEVDEIATKKVDNEIFNRVTIKKCTTSLVEDTFQLPIYSELVALPDRGNFYNTKLSYQFNEINLNNKIININTNDLSPLYNKDQWYPNNIVTVGKPVIMRGQRFSQISISPIQYNPHNNTIRILKEVDCDFEIDASDNRNPLIRQLPSSHFSKIINNKIIGAESRDLIENGSYLFIAQSSVSDILQPLLRWKEQLGFKTQIAIIEEIGSTAEEIKAYIQNAYDNWQDPPEFIVLVGDVSGNIQCPSFYVDGYLTPFAVSDHNFALLDGDDYFPDAFVGRLSCQTQLELMTIISKIINYESNPFMNIPWQKRALMVGYIDEWNGFSQRETLMGIRNKLLDFEYAAVDTFIAPWQTGQSLLSNSISEGESFICYRGAGAPNYWSGGLSGPMFLTEDIITLNNGFMLPMVTSMTCGGGDFASQQYPICFGEKWLNSGSPSEPQGAIAFIGPSEYDTKTWFNNANAMGIYQGVTQEGLYRCGEMLLRGKMELYYNYPNNHAWGNALDSDQFYFYVYNLLGDPGLQIQTDVPEVVEMQYDEQIPYSDNFIEVQIINSEDDFSDFTIAITNEDSLITKGITDESGSVLIPIELAAGNYEVTASKYGFIPLTSELEVINEAELILNEYSFTESLISGNITILEFSLENLSSSNLNNVVITPICSNENILFVNEPISEETINAGAVFSAEFDLEINDQWADGMNVQVMLQITSDEGDFEFLMPAEITSPEIVVSDFIPQNVSNCLIQNETNEITIELLNCGSYETGAFQAELICLNENAIVENSLYYFSNTLPNEVAIGDFTIIPQNVMTGELAQFELELTCNESFLQTVYFNYPIGIIDSTSVTFSGNGYYAIESTDEGNFETPEYDWIEIDPAYGGDGIKLDSDHTTIDGFAKVIPLPFQFNYFGEFYDQVSVCSEGYISFDPTPLIFHRNRNIPSAIGPAGMIAPFWDNLTDGRIYAKYDEENNYFIIQWSDFINEFDGSNEIFQMILYDPEFYFTSEENKLVKFQYKEINNYDQDTNYATVGIENYQQTEGLLITFADIYPNTAHILQNETAILFRNNAHNSISFINVNPDEFSFSVPADSVFSVDLNISNELGDSEISYDISLAHFAKLPPDYTSDFNQEYSRNIENSQIFNMTNTYIPIEPMTFLFYLIYNDIDGEGVNGISIDFPPGFYINSANDVDELNWNGETGYGAEVSWGFEPGNSISPTSATSILVNVTIDEDQTSPVDIDWFIQGDGSGSAPHEVSGTFTVNPTEDIYFWVTYPNGGETIVPSIPDTLKWNKYGDVDFVKLLLTRDNGTSFEVISEMADNSGEFPHIFTGPLSDDCWFAVSTLDETTFDISDNSFSISAFNIVQPNENSILSYGEQDTLIWQDTGNYEEVKIEFSANNGYSWEAIAASTLNDGLFLFDVPGPPSEYCMIRISDLTGNVQNISRTFTIVDSPVDWLSVENNSGTIPAGEIDENSFMITTAGLEPATYVAVIKIITSIGQIVNLPLTLEVFSTIPPYQGYHLKQNYPNPFNPFTKIVYNVPEAGKVSIKIYNIKGQFIKTLVNEVKEPGDHETYWDGTDNKQRKVSSGVYLYQLKAGNTEKNKKMILVK